MKTSILIVEDNPTNMRLFADLLAAVGYEVHKAEDAEIALEMLKTLKPDTIVMDIQLPGISGMECTQRIKADSRLKHIPVIAVTAFAMVGDEARFRAAGCDDYLPKPITVASFLEKVAEHSGQEPMPSGSVAVG